FANFYINTRVTKIRVLYFKDMSLNSDDYINSKLCWIEKPIFTISFSFSLSKSIPKSPDLSKFRERNPKRFFMNKIFYPERLVNVPIMNNISKLNTE
ncbi:hypothetical protein BpHYR1_019098, partial [Brachionus plicatilis]